VGTLVASPPVCDFSSDAPSINCLAGVFASRCATSSPPLPAGVHHFVARFASVPGGPGTHLLTAYWLSGMYHKSETYGMEDDSAMPVLALVNRKGGVGKSTVCVNLAACLAERGERVLVCDLDPQAAATFHLGVDYTQQPSLLDVLQGDRSIAQVVLPTRHGVDLAPSSPFLVNAETQLLQVAGCERLFAEQLEAASIDYGWILLDTPPSLGILTLSGLGAADVVLIVATPEFASVEAVGQTMETIAVVRRRLNQKLRLLGVIANRVEARVRSVDEVCRRIQGLGVPLLASRVRKTVRLADAFGFQEPILTFDPRHPVCNDIRDLTEEVVRLASS